MNPWLKGLIALWPFAIGSLTPLNALIMLSLGQTLRTSILWPLLMNYGPQMLFCLPFSFPGPPLSDVFQRFRERLGKSPVDGFSLVAGVVSSAGIGIQAYCSGRIGFGVTYVTTTCVMVVLSALIDSFGLLWAVRRRLRVVDYVSIVLIVVGTAVWVFERGPGTTGPEGVRLSPAEYGGTVVLAAVGAASLLSSGPLNKRLSQSTGNTFRTTLFASAVASVAIVSVAAGVDPHPQFHRIDSSNWWKLLTCVLGFSMFLTSQNAPRWIGFALSNRARVAGNLVGALLLDVFALGTDFRSHPDKPGAYFISPGVASGAALVLVGLAVSLRPPPPVEKGPQTPAEESQGAEQKRERDSARETGGSGSESDEGDGCHCKTVSAEGVDPIPSGVEDLEVGNGSAKDIGSPEFLEQCHPNVCDSGGIGETGVRESDHGSSCNRDTENGLQHTERKYVDNKGNGTEK